MYSIVYSNDAQKGIFRYCNITDIKQIMFVHQHKKKLFTKRSSMHDKGSYPHYLASSRVLNFINPALDARIFVMHLVAQGTYVTYFQYTVFNLKKNSNKATF